MNCWVLLTSTMYVDELDELLSELRVSLFLVNAVGLGPRPPAECLPAINDPRKQFRGLLSIIVG